MADEKKELSKEELEAMKKLEEAVEPIEGDKREIRDLIDETKDVADEAKEKLQDKTDDVKDTIKESIDEVKEDIKDKEEAIEQEVKDSAKEIEEGAKELQEELEDEAKELETPKLAEVKKEELKPKGAKNKNLIAQSKIEEVRNSVKEVEQEVQEVVDGVKAKIAEFEEYEAAVLNGVIATAKKRLSDIGFEEEEKEFAVPKAEIEPEDRPISINDISSGAGGAFFTGLLGGLATLIGWCVYASKVQGVPFPPHKLPTVPELTAKASAIASSLGAGESAEIGAGIAVGSALVIFFIIYKVMVSMRASKNLEISKRLEENAKEYSKKKLEFKEMVLKIGEHVDELKETTEKFEVLLDEKSASLKRAKLFESVDNFDELNPKTQEVATDADKLVRELEDLLAAPMAKDAVLNDESIEALNRAKELVSAQVDKIYK